jgi:hypothetical protein
MTLRGKASAPLKYFKINNWKCVEVCFAISALQRFTASCNAALKNGAENMYYFCEM